MNKVILHHGVHNLEKKQAKLIVNSTNRNEIIAIIGPPSTKSTFDNDVFIYIEKKTSSAKLTKLGKKKLLVNNVLVLEIDNYGLLKKKDFFNKDKMNNIKITKNVTGQSFKKKSFIYEFMSSMRQKINDPLNKRAENQKKINQR